MSSGQETGQLIQLDSDALAREASFVKREAQEGTCLSGLFGFLVERNSPDEPNQPNQQNKPNKRESHHEEACAIDGLLSRCEGVAHSFAGRQREIEPGSGAEDCL